MAQVYDPRPCRLGEGPLWHPERNQLFWFDILGQRMLSRAASAPLEWEFGECVSAAGWIDRDTLLVAGERALMRLEIGSGKRSEICALEADNPSTRPNDGRADPQGGFWIGTMGKAAEPGAGAIYRYYRGGLTRLLGGLTIPNAISFAPGGRIAYFADTPMRKIMRQALDGAGWPLGAPEVFVDLGADGPAPDGAVVDAEGGLWNAQWGAGRVARYRANGQFDRALAVPGRLSTCPAFGAAGLGALFVTTASEGIDAPDAAEGPVYRLTPGVAGQAEHRVQL